MRRFVTRKSTSKLRNQAHAPQSAAAARTLGLLATSLSLLSQSFSLSAIDHARLRHGNGHSTPGTREKRPAAGQLRRVFRGKFVDRLKSAFQRGQLHLYRDLALLAQPKFFAAWLRPLFRKNWVVYSKPPFGGPEYVLQHLGRYTHRVAISNHRLVSLAKRASHFSLARLRSQP